MIFRFGFILVLCVAGWVQAQEATIRKNLAERLPTLPKIDEVSKTPMNGLFEVRIGTDVVYTDAEGNFLIQGTLIDTRLKRNLTEERTENCWPFPLTSCPSKTPSPRSGATANANWWCLQTPIAATASASRKTS